MFKKGFAALFGLLICFSLSGMALAAEGDVRLGVVTADQVNVRAGASTEADVIGMVDADTKVVILGSSGKYFKIEYKGSEGYIVDDYVAVYSSQSGKVNADNVVLRTSASTESEKIITLDDGDRVNVYGEKDSFYRVTYGEYDGYISTQYVSVSSSSASSSSKSSSEAPKNSTRQTKVGSYTDEELALVARLIYAEGKSQSSSGYEAMASVVYNRLVSKKYPNSIEAIVFQENQFTVTKDRDAFMGLKPNKRATSAVQKVFVEGVVCLPADVMYFKSARLSRDWGGREYYDTIEGNMYYS